MLETTTPRSDLATKQHPFRQAENIGNRNESSPYGQGFGTNPAYGGFQQEFNHHYGSESMDEFAAALNQLADETANLGMILTQNQIESSGENAQLRQAVYTLCAILDGTRPALQPSEIAAFSLSTSWTRAPRSGSSMRSVRQWRSLENRVHALSSVAVCTVRSLRSGSQGYLIMTGPSCVSIATTGSASWNTTSCPVNQLGWQLPQRRRSNGARTACHPNMS